MKLTLDTDGYPTDECLESIEKEEIKNVDSALEMLRELRSLWAYAEWGWKEKIEGDKIKFHISTAGWSGNESIIAAMKRNFIFWSLSWEQSRRGGHYIFEFPLKAT